MPTRRHRHAQVTVRHLFTSHWLHERRAAVSLYIATSEFMWKQINQNKSTSKQVNWTCDHQQDVWWCFFYYAAGELTTAHLILRTSIRVCVSGSQLLEIQPQVPKRLRTPRAYVNAHQIACPPPQSDQHFFKIFLSYWCCRYTNNSIIVSLCFKSPRRNRCQILTVPDLQTYSKTECHMRENQKN